MGVGLLVPEPAAPVTPVVTAPVQPVVVPIKHVQPTVVPNQTLKLFKAQAKARALAKAKAIRWLSGKIHGYQHATWHWQRVMGQGLTPLPKRSLSVVSVESLAQLKTLWKKRATETRQRAQHPPHFMQFMCIHHYEGAWNANTGNGYFGGVQMNKGFMAAYGSYLLKTKGTADKWTPLEQIWVAEHAYPSRGFGPWPNTSRSCGL
jgi:hypothetical protein